MPYNKTKRFKWQKIGIVALAVMTMLSVCASAVYTSGSETTPRYTAPLRFDFEIFGTTAQLTPTISYISGQSLTYDTYEQAEQSNSTITSINRTNFGVSLVGNTAVDISYRLKFNVSESVDNFTIKIVAPYGMYDFDKYGIPQISVPTGYDVSVKTTYNMRFTQNQTYTDSVGHYVQKTYTVAQNGLIPLLYDRASINGTEHDIIGGVLIDKYVTELTFTKRGENGGTDGNAGYYLWDSTISYTGYDIEDWLLGGDFSLNCNGVRLIGSTNGVVDTVNVTGFYFTRDNVQDVGLYYDLDPDQTVLAYDFYLGRWYSATADDNGIVVDLITAEQMRMLYFTLPFDEAMGLHTLDTSEVTDQLIAHKAELFRAFLYGESTYYAENPLTMTLNTDGATYSFTDGDGGMYLHYYADRMLGEEHSSTLSDWYHLGYMNGFGGGGEFNGDYTSWMATAVGGFLDAEIFPNFTLGGVLGVLVALGLLVMFLKFFAGG